MQPPRRGEALWREAAHGRDFGDVRKKTRQRILHKFTAFFQPNSAWAFNSHRRAWEVTTGFVGHVLTQFLIAHFVFTHFAAQPLREPQASELDQEICWEGERPYPRKQPQESRINRGENRMKFLLGLSMGVALGLILAPARGEETRELLKQKAEELAEIPRQKAVELADISEQKAGEMGARIGRELAQSSVQAVREKVLKENKTA